MQTVEVQVRRMAAVSSVMLMAAIEAMGQDNTRTPRRILVSIPDRKLAVMENDRVIRIFEVAVGAPVSPSPTGTFKIINQLENPDWYTKGRVVPAGKNNPLGPRWMGLSVKGYGIHGTNAPKSIGSNASHGCIRLRNSDVEQLFKMVAVGDQVELQGERTEEIVNLFGGRVVTVVTVADAVNQ